MSSVFSSNKQAGMLVEDVNAQRLRQQEQQRAEEDKIKATQDQLGVETRLRNRRFGVRSLFDTGASSLRSYLGAG
jgi:hypothetical protein